MGEGTPHKFGAWRVSAGFREQHAWFMLHGWGAKAPHTPHLRLRPGGLRPPGPPHWRIRARVKCIWYIGIIELVRGHTGTGP